MMNAIGMLLRRKPCLWRASHTLASLASRPSIILAGAPGSGKTTVGKIVAAKLQREFRDFDDDLLEKRWNMSVADKLRQLGDDGFLDAEAEVAQEFQIPPNLVLSLSGSVPLRNESIQKLSKFGTVVLLDVESSAIVARMNEMKVDRIVGQGKESLPAILRRRNSSYESCYDYRLVVEQGELPESIADRVIAAVNKEEGFISTRDSSLTTSAKSTFTDVVQLGLSPDRGLYLPKQLPTPFSRTELERMIHLSYQERAIRVMEKFPLGHLHPSKLREFVNAAYTTFSHPSIVPLTHLEDNLFTLDTFHGPTASFKDLALQLTPRFLSYATENHPLDGQSLDLALLVATSGDTGVAALNGFVRLNDVPIVVLYPHKGVSRIQKHQMLCDASHSCVLGVKGDFDVCQTAVKDIFEDAKLNARLRQEQGILLSAGNSINWGRLLPQTVFSVSAYLDLVKDNHISLGDSMDVAIPTGNFGNLLGSYLARQMGVPIEHLVCVSNANNILSDFVDLGVYDLRNRRLQRTHSPSVDILMSSNLERFLYLLSGGDAELVCQLYRDLQQKGVFYLPQHLKQLMQSELTSGWCSETECLDTIKQTLAQTGRLLDPHTALARSVVEPFRRAGNRPMVVQSTAHYSKFPAAIVSALGLKPTSDSIEDTFAALASVDTTSAMHPALQALASIPEQNGVFVDGNVDAIRHRVLEYLGTKSVSSNVNSSMASPRSDVKY